MDIDVVDPELRQALRKLPVPNVASKFMRTVVRWAMSRMLRAHEVAGVTIEDHREGEVRVRIYTPAEKRSSAASLWVHGGGLVIGVAKQDDQLCGETASELGITVVSAEYRLAPKAPYPAALDDVSAAWDWLIAHADGLGIDPARIVLGGESTGGGLAACLAQRLHDSAASLRQHPARS